MILAGLWCATTKPPCFPFLEPLCNSLAKIQTEGICIVTCSYIANYSNYLFQLSHTSKKYWMITVIATTKRWLLPGGYHTAIGWPCTIQLR